MTGEHELDPTAVLSANVQKLLGDGKSREAADLLLARFSPELRPFLHRLLGDGALADEAHSATCERIWRGLASFRFECSLRSWSYIIARREASRCRARHARARVQETTLSAADQLPHAPTTATISTAGRDQLEHLRTTLSDEDRDLLVLRVERGLSWKEIAASFLEEDQVDAELVAREAARLRQRFRSIRVTVSSAIAERRAKSRDEG